MKIMNAKELIENNSLANFEVAGGQTVVFTEIAMTAINMAREEGAEWQAKQSPWISVEDKEPLTNEPILVILEGRPVIMVLCGWDSRLGHHPNVTHWMPIPKFNE